MSEMTKNVNLTDEALALAVAAIDEERPADAVQHLKAAAASITAAEVHGQTTGPLADVVTDRMCRVVRLLAVAADEESLLAPW